jgi:hypothetical protein
MGFRILWFGRQKVRNATEKPYRGEALRMSLAALVPKDELNAKHRESEANTASDSLSGTLPMSKRSGQVAETAAYHRRAKRTEVVRGLSFGFCGFFFESFFAHALACFVFPFDPAEGVVDHKAFA